MKTETHDTQNRDTIYNLERDRQESNVYHVYLHVKCESEIHCITKIIMKQIHLYTMHKMYWYVQHLHKKQNYNMWKNK